MKLKIFNYFLYPTKSHELIKIIIVFSSFVLNIVLITILIVLNVDFFVDDPGFLFSYSSSTSEEQTLFFEEISVNRDIDVEFSTFESLIDLFKENGSINKYFPSYFINDKLKLLVDTSYENNSIVDDKSLIKVKYYDQYFSVKYSNNCYNNLINDLHYIVTDYIKNI